MAFFPMFTNLEDKRVLVVGGGVVASRKIETLLTFKPQEIYIVAKALNDSVKRFGKRKTVKLNEREFRTEDLENKDMVIVAADDTDLQMEIFKECKNKNIPVNCVDSPKYCSFIFPSVIVKGDFVIGISTSGKAPFISKKMRKFLEKIIPDSMNEIVNEASNIRSSFTKEKEKNKELSSFAKNRFGFMKVKK